MAKDKKEERNLSLNDIRGAVAEEHPERDAGLSAMMAMTSDTMEEQQPDGTYRFALNAVNEDRHEAGRLQNEESNEKCVGVPDIQKNGRVIFTDCCKSKLGMFDYNSSNIDTFISSLDGDCGLYVHNDIWTIQGVSGTFTKSQLKNWLLANIGTYRIYPYGCESDEIEITIVSCCPDKKKTFTATVTDGFQITESILYDMLSECGNELFSLGNEDNNVVKVNGVEYDIDHLPLITEDAVVYMLCTTEKPCECLDGIEANDAVSFDGGTTITLNESADSCNGLFYSLASALNGQQSLYAAFQYGDCYIDGITIRLNGRNIPPKEGYDDSIDEYFYLDGNGNIIVKFNVDKNGIYKFVFYIKNWCGDDKEISVEIRVKVKIYSEDGTEIGYVLPSALISNASDDSFVIGGVSASGLYGRTYDIYTIDKYYINTPNGETVEIAFNGYPIDYRYNNSIIVHLS